MTAITAAGIATYDTANANRLHAIALSRQLAAEALSIDSFDPVTARQLAVAAWYVFPTEQADSTITTLMTEQQQDSMLPVTSDGVDGVAFGPDGKILASADADGTVRLWNPVTGQSQDLPLQVGAAPPGAVGAVAFSPDGKILAAAYSKGTVQLWNPATGQPLGPPLRPHGPDRLVNGVAFTPDGKILATADADGTVRLWNPATRQSRGLPLQVGAARVGGVTAVAFSPDGKILATADSDGTIQLWNPATRQPLARPCTPARVSWPA